MTAYDEVKLDLLARDGLHLSFGGAQLFAKAISRVLTKVISKELDGKCSSNTYVLNSNNN